MAHTKIPFSPEMSTACREGRKVCTTRSRQMGEVGDTFEVTGLTYRIVDIQKGLLSIILADLYRQEGFESPEAFETLWRRLHRGHLSVDREYYVHWFARAEGTE